MNTIRTAVLPLLLISLTLKSGISTAQPPQKNNLLIGVFEGRTPCRELAGQLNETTAPDCMKIKWRLILYTDSLDENSGTYLLEGFVFRRDKAMKGVWHIIKGTQADPEATVYRIEREGKEPLWLQKADDNVLFFLDRQKNLMVGNRDFSYTLNRVPKHL